MQFTITRDALLNALGKIMGAVEKRQTFPILAHVLIQIVDDGRLLKLTSTDLEVELSSFALISQVDEDGVVTVPARKLYDICRTLPADVDLTFTQDQERIVIRSGRSRFNLATLPAAEFPHLEQQAASVEGQINSQQLKKLLSGTQFAMANQDVRFYLNGMLLEITNKVINTVATNGHRLALTSVATEIDGGCRVIVPRKGVLELQHLFDKEDELLTLQIASHYIQISADNFSFSSKLIDGQYPEYQRVIPNNVNEGFIADRDELKGVFSRAAIFSTENFGGVRLNLTEKGLQIMASNSEQEAAEEELLVEYKGEEVDLGFNVQYLLDVLNILPEGNVKWSFGTDNPSLLVESQIDSDSLYVVMPMRL